MKKLLALIVSLVMVMAILLPASAFSSVPAKSIKLNSTKVSLKVGEAFSLKVTFNPANTTSKLLTFSTSNKKVASVDKNGKITAVAVGSATITVATSNKKTAKITVSVAKKEVAKLTFSWWGDSDRATATLNAIGIWNKANPDIQVEGIPLSNEGFIDKLTTQLAGGNAPDLFNTTAGDIPNYADNGLLVDLTPYIGTYFKSIDSSLWKYYTNGKDSRAWGIPFGENGNVIAYNKTKLTQLGLTAPTNKMTWDDFLAAIKAAAKDTNGDGKVDFWGYHYVWLFGPDMANYYLRQLGYKNGMFTDDLKHSVFGDPKVIAAFKKFEAVRSYCPEPGVMQLKEGQQPIAAGYVAYQSAAYSNFSGIAQSTNDELDLLPYPSLPGGKEVRESIGGICFDVNAKSKNKDAALKFASWFTSDPVAGKTLGGARGILPSQAQRDAYGKELAANPNNTTGKLSQKVINISNFISSLKAVNPVPKSPVAMQEWQTMYDEESQVYEYGQETLEQFFANVVKKGDPILEKQ